ncbi:MAG: hydroxyacid dehydrogenase [Nitrospirae bacterium]|nr:MAG: hydroxyacid dehydrogenase [Nitrospirota bacterium]
MKIAITTSSFGKYDTRPLDILGVKGYEIVLNPYKRTLSEGEVLEVCNGVVGIIAGTEPLRRDTLKALQELKVISRCGTGMDNVDVIAAENIGIKVYNTPDAPTLAVVELAVGMILSLLRNVREMDASVRNNRWEKVMGNLLNGKTAGIIGFGRIGRKLAEVLKYFGCIVVFHDISNAVESGGFDRVDLKDLLSRSDIVSLHVSSKTLIMGEDEISRMKKGAWLINVSRGGVVDEGALYKSLKAGHLRGAALDVYEKEPYEGPLTGLENVVLTPHVGSYAVESRVEMEVQAVQNLLKGLGCPV